MDHNKYMTTGEFARRMGVTKNTLFHYDYIGLFSPEIVDTNEYRYYSIYQNLSSKEGIPSGLFLPFFLGMYILFAGLGL